MKSFSESNIRSDQHCFGVDYSFDGQILAAVAGDDCAIFHQPKSSEYQRIGLSEAGLCGRFHPNQRLVVIGTVNGNLLFLDPESGEEIGQPVNIPGGNAILRLHFCQKTASIFVASGDRVWTVKTDSRKLIDDSLNHTQLVVDVSSANDGNTIATACLDGFVRIWHHNNGKFEPVELEVEGLPERVAFNADASQVSAVTDEGLAYIWDVETGHLACETIARKQLGVVAFSPDQNELFAFGNSNTSFHLELAEAWINVNNKLLEVYAGRRIENGVVVDLEQDELQRLRQELIRNADLEGPVKFRFPREKRPTRLLQSGALIKVAGRLAK